MAKSSNHDIYVPLLPGETRILQLQPGKPGSSLIATFKHSPLQERSFEQRYERNNLDLVESPREHDLRLEAMRSTYGFEAISYAWGDPRRTRVLYIEGKGTIGITESLHGALQQFRRAEGTRYLWADAVCINQADENEKATQVAKMHVIYGSADLVLIWLGSSQSQDALAFATINACGEVACKSSTLDWRPSSLSETLHQKLLDVDRCICCDQIFDNKASNLSKDGILAFADLLFRSWFTRLWVVQEVDFKTTPGAIFSGPHRVSINTFVHAVVILIWAMSDRRLAIPVSYHREVEATVEQFLFEYECSTPGTHHVWKCISQASRRDCSDPRDRVYALRSCLKLNHIEALKPDYTISTQECYRRLTCFMLQEANFPDLSLTPRLRFPWIPLTLVGTENESTVLCSGWPSWIPKFHMLSERSRNKLQIGYVPFNDDYQRFKYMLDPGDISRIKLKGSRYGILRTPAVESRWPVALDIDDKSAEERRVELVAWYRRCKYLVLSELIPFGGISFATFHKLLLGCDSTSLSGPTDNLLINRLLETWLDNPNTIEAHFEVVRRFVNTLNAYYVDKGRYLCVIHHRNGTDIGWVPMSARGGDQICVFGGSPCPFIHRPCNDGTFKLLGDAYTAFGTLKEALGGESDSTSERPSCMADSMDWATNDREMMNLMDNMSWITLR